MSQERLDEAERILPEKGKGILAYASSRRLDDERVIKQYLAAHFRDMKRQVDVLMH